MPTKKQSTEKIEQLSKEMERYNLYRQWQSGLLALPVTTLPILIITSFLFHDVSVPDKLVEYPQIEYFFDLAKAVFAFSMLITGILISISLKYRYLGYSFTSTSISAFHVLLGLGIALKFAQFF